MATHVKAVIFDLGGVLVELGGQPFDENWLTGNPDFDHAWQRWLHSPSVRQFDQGKITISVFADSMIQEMELATSQQEFIDWLENWPKDFFGGTEELLRGLASQYELALFSNTNSLHWPKYCKFLQQLNCFDHFFISYQLGITKPDVSAFEFVANKMQTPIADILFLDDVPVNVQAARKAGMQAYCVKGLLEAKDYLLSKQLWSAK